MADILVDLGWLEDLQGEISGTVDDLNASPSDAVKLENQPILDRGVTHFMKRWDEKGEELGASLDAVLQLTTAIHDSFKEADTQLGDSTQCTS